MRAHAFWGIVAVLSICACKPTARSTTVVTTSHVPFSTHTRAGGVHGKDPNGDIERAIREACERNGLTLDERLAEVADAIARTSDGAQKAPSYARVNSLSHRAGLIEPTPEIWLASAGSNEELLGAILEAVSAAAQTNKLTHCGGAVVEEGNRKVVALALSARLLSLSKDVPAQIDKDQPLELEGALARGYKTPTLAVTSPSGQVSRTPLGKGEKIAHSLTLPETGHYAIELLAEGPGGISVVANFPVAVGVSPAEVSAEDEDDGPSENDAAEVTRKLAELIAEERKSHDLPPLTLERRLDKVALNHSRDMVAHHFIAHTSPSTGDAPDRVTRAGLASTLVLENIGRGYSAREIHRGLMESPGHRANILHPDARELGIGVVSESEGERLAFVATEVFARLAREVATSDAPKVIERELSMRRRAKKLRPIVVDTALSAVAQRAADALAADPTRDQEDELEKATEAVKNPPKGLRTLGAALVIAVDVDQVASSERLLDRDLRWLGIGVARSEKLENPPYVVVLLLGSQKAK